MCIRDRMKYANKIGAKNTVVLGSDELEKRVAVVKNMDTHEQTEVALDEITGLFK